MQRHLLTATLLAALALPALAQDGAAPAATPAPAAPAVAAPAPAVATPAPAATESASLGVADSVIKLIISTQAPNILTPWKLEPISTGIASGVVISGNGKNYILVSGSSVNFVTQIETLDKVPMAVAFRAAGGQLALLEVKDPAQAAAFFKKHPPVEFTEYPSAVTFAGYDGASNELAAISGLVRDTQIANSSGSLTLRSQVALEQFREKTAFGPAFFDRKLAGFFLAAQLSEDKKSAAAAFIPTAEIKVFLADAKDGKIDGKWAFKKSFGAQHLVNPALRAKLGLADDVHGILITGEADAIAPFKPWDVLTALGSAPVDNTGNTRIGGAQGFDGPAFYLLNANVKADTQTLPVTVLRDGKSVQLEIPVTRRGDQLMPSLMETNTAPRYFVFGPMCFEQATAELAQAMTQRRGAELALSGSPIGAHLNDNTKTTPDEEIVVLSNLLPHTCANGYGPGSFPAVKAVNGQAVTSLRQLAKLLVEGKDPFIEITFHDKNAEILVFKRADMAEATTYAKRTHGVGELCSDDLKDLVK